MQTFLDKNHFHWKCSLNLQMSTVKKNRGLEGHQQIVKSNCTLVQYDFSIRLSFLSHSILIFLLDCEKAQTDQNIRIFTCVVRQHFTSHDLKIQMTNIISFKAVPYVRCFFYLVWFITCHWIL